MATSTKPLPSVAQVVTHDDGVYLRLDNGAAVKLSLSQARRAATDPAEAEAILRRHA